MAFKLLLTREVLTIVIIGFTFSLILGIVHTILPLYLRLIGLSMLGIGFIFSFYEICLILSNVLIGLLCSRSRLGVRAILFISLILHSLTSLLYSFSHHVFQIEFYALIRGLRGLASSMKAIGIRSIISRLKFRGSIFSSYSSSCWIGKGLGIFLGAVLLVHLGFVHSFYACTILSLLCSISILFLTRNLTTHRSSCSSAAQSYSRVLQQVFILCFPIHFAVGLLIVIIPIYVFEYAVIPIHMYEYISISFYDLGLLGLILSSMYFVSGVSQLLFGSLSDRIGRFPFIILGCFFSSVIRFLLPLNYDLIYLTVLLIFTYLFYGMIIPSLNSLLLDLVKRGEVDIGLYNLFKELGIALGVFTSGIVADVSFSHAFYISALLFTIAGIHALYIFVHILGLSSGNVNTS